MAVASTAGLPDATKLAVDRTRLAHDRTLMAWVRTSTSLISFGFTIYKFFQYLREKESFSSEGFLGPRGFALMMIAIGLVALAVATLEHRRSLHALRNEYGLIVPRSLATILATLVALLGIFGLVLVALRR
jgi:putative membrane protein